MQLVGLGPAALAPAGPTAAHSGPTPVGQRVSDARRFVAFLVLAAALLIAAAAFATAIAPNALAADPPPAPTPPVATIAVTGSVHFAGQPVAFADVSTGEPTSREWAFGDDSDVSHREKPEHTFAAAGTYTVTLTVSNDAGSSVATVRVTILATWAGGVQLYKAGVYSKQVTMRLCVAASNQMIRNMVFGERDHTTATQKLYNAWGRGHNGYKTPAAAGVDPGGWQSMLRRYVDPGYRIFAAGSYGSALKQAAKAIRLTGRPVGVFVAHGIHVWVISGFTATADPATTNTFKVLTVNVEGPLFGIRPSINGYDPTPNIRMSVSRFSHYLLPFRDPYEPKAVWRNKYVIVVP
jgi:PKD repeat protein